MNVKVRIELKDGTQQIYGNCKKIKNTGNRFFITLEDGRIARIRHKEINRVQIIPYVLEE